ncbi:hypothetical protein V8E54_008830 [Elaphomyces granulatus]
MLDHSSLQKNQQWRKRTTALNTTPSKYRCLATIRVAVVTLILIIIIIPITAKPPNTRTLERHVNDKGQAKR